MDASSLRNTFTKFFVDRGHEPVPSAGLIPHHPTAPLFTNSGMMQFVPYFLGEEPAPWPRATSVQKCVRLSGKHNDISELGKTRRHLTFFEMLGNWSFGDYFKEEAIQMAWDLVTDVIGIDGDRLWITVHTTDDDAEAIWHDRIGLPMERIQRLGKDNFWEMGETGPCGPSSEIHFDFGPEWGEAGGPAQGGGDRYVEFWNLVFMDQFRSADGSLSPLPTRNVDTGGGLERFLLVLEDVRSLFETDALRPYIAKAESLTGHRYGADEKADWYLRIIGDHARTMTFLVNDGVTPSNEARGYILRSVIRRAVRRAHQLGVERIVLPELVDSVIDGMGGAYPDLIRNRDGIKSTIEHEEDRFRRTLKTGSALLEEQLDRGEVTGDMAFKLHDTYGFPVELTEEIAAEHDLSVDRSRFTELMEEQRTRAKDAAKSTSAADFDLSRYREITTQKGSTEFVGYTDTESESTITEVLDAGDGHLEVFLDRTPFYAEGGGQVGDTGTLSTASGEARVIDTTAPILGLHRHVAVIINGEIKAGDAVRAVVDHERREAIRRNHTGTHLLHWALREVLGPHVKQQGSLVAPERLRFDFSHHSQVAPEDLQQVEDLANMRILANEPVRAFETSKAEAEKLGAMAFFGDKYGEVVRVIEAGTKSTELCGGTHVDALGMIGPVKIVSESSIGSNLRRVEAVTGAGTVEWMRAERHLLERAAALLKSPPEELPAAIERLLAQRKVQDEEMRGLRSQMARGEARALAADAVGGFIVARRDLPRDVMAELAKAVRQEPEVKGVVLVGSPEGKGVAIAVAAEKGVGVTAPELGMIAAGIVGGGGNTKDPTYFQAGGKDASRIDEALDAVRAHLNSR